MGLFDGYGLSDTSQGFGGSFLDRIMAQLQGQNQQQQFSGLPSDQAQYGQPMNAMAQVQPAQMQPNPQPSPLDNAQWPYGPSGAPSQANAQAPIAQPTPAIGPQSVPMQPAPQMQPPVAQPSFLQQQHSPGGFGGAMRGVVANASGGPLGWLGGGVAGALGMGEGSDKDQQRAILAAKYNSLVPILGEQKALIAVLSPETGDKMLAQQFGPQTLTPLGEGYVADKNGNIKRAYEPGDKNKVVQIGQDGLGRQQYGVFNPSDGSIKPVAAPGTTADSGGLGNMDLTGKEYLASLPQGVRGQVQGLLDGTLAPPSSFAAAKTYWQNLLTAAKNADPSFDTVNWGARAAGAKDFSAGKSAEMVRSANQTIHHVGSLIDSMDALNNGDYPLWNKIGNATEEAKGGGAQGSFRSNAHAVATELSKVFKGSNLSDAEVHAWEQNLHENMSPEQQRTQVAKLGELLQGSLQALEEKRIASIGPAAAEKQGPLIKKDGQRVLQRIQDWIAKGSGKSAPAPGPLSAGESTKVGNVTIRRVN